MSRIAPPRLQTMGEGGHRTATWLELFYDLAFVVAIAILGERLFDDTTWTGLWSFFGYFALLWWLWASHTFYADRYDTDDLVYRLWAAAQMVAVLVMAASLAHGPSESTTVFAAGYAGARLVLLALYWRVYRYVSETRRLVTGYLIGFGMAAVVWLASVFVPDPARFAVWGIAFAIDLATPWVIRRQQATVPLDESHLPERFGLFVILVLGESLAAVVAGLSHVGWTTSSLVAAVLGALLATLLWWLYFDNAEGSVVRRRNIEGKTWRPTGWIYSHLPLAAALAIVGVALDQAILSAGAGPMPSAQRWLLLGGVALALVCLAILQIASLNYSKESVNRVIAINRLAGVPFLALIGLLVQADPLWVLAGATGVCVAVLAADMVA
jgi:low temperature requirement protein LtrA